MTPKTPSPAEIVIRATRFNQQASDGQWHATIKVGNVLFCDDGTDAPGSDRRYYVQIQSISPAPAQPVAAVDPGRLGDTLAEIDDHANDAVWLLANCRMLARQRAELVLVNRGFALASTPESTTDPTALDLDAIERRRRLAMDSGDSYDALEHIVDGDVPALIREVRRLREELAECHASGEQLLAEIEEDR